MDISPLRPNDDRVKTVTATVRGKTYEYILAEPKSTPLDTIFLIHGFPDIPHGWRNQVPYLQSLGFRVVVPSMIGYAGTDAPKDIRQYTLKSASDDIKELAAQIVGPGKQIILGGHDWGGAIVWRVALYHPQLLRAVFSICTPYFAPQTTYYDTQALVDARLPQFAYQLQFQGADVETRIVGADQLRQFFCALYAGLGAGNEVGFDARKGVLFENLGKLNTPRLLPEQELRHYVEQYMRQPGRPLRGPLNWYRTRRLNYEDELPLAKAGTRVEMPALYVAASRDTALPPAMSRGIERYITDLTRAEVNASHWALTQRGPEVNAIIGKWLNQVLGGKIKASL